jgi:hypothetical protein
VLLNKRSLRREMIYKNHSPFSIITFALPQVARK